MAKKEMIKSFVLRVDAETMEAIEKWAADEFRSTNGQLSMDYSGNFAQEWQNEEKEDNNQKRRNRMIQLF